MKTICTVILCLIALVFASCQKDTAPGQATGTLKITFKNVVNGSPMQLNTGSYTNIWGEQYNITKFKYYISNIAISNPADAVLINSYYLIDESNPTSLSFNLELPVSTYSILNFLIGVDSARNVSGAQTGALDPLNDMFWTWSSGYIMAKMEGNSPQSPVLNNKIEYHIGGFSGNNNVLKKIGLLISNGTNTSVNIREGKMSEIVIESDFNKWWQGSFNLKINENPVIATTGAVAKSISDNYKFMFNVTDIKNY